MVRDVFSRPFCRTPDISVQKATVPFSYKCALVDAITRSATLDPDRYKQQIAEMEAAMKSTWEEKSKQSESSERERQRLQRQASGNHCVSVATPECT